MKETECCHAIEYSVLEEKHQEMNQNRCPTSAWTPGYQHMLRHVVLAKRDIY